MDQRGSFTIMWALERQHEGNEIPGPSPQSTSSVLTPSHHGSREPDKLSSGTHDAVGSSASRTRLSVPMLEWQERAGPQSWNLCTEGDVMGFHSLNTGEEIRDVEEDCNNLGAKSVPASRGMVTENGSTSS